MSINPIRIYGNWTEGWSLDNHSESSKYIGESIYGNTKYDTKRTKLGELILQFKYRDKYDKLESIIEEIKPFLDNWKVLKNVNVIMPIPPSKIRIYQPAIEIAKAISGYLNINFTDEILQKTSNIESKNMNKTQKDLSNTIIALKKAKKTFTVLLVDDVYDTGKTLNECCKILKEDAMLKEIYVLTMTKTKERIQ